jgi:hypothetical protein
MRIPFLSGPKRERKTLTVNPSSPQQGGRPKGAKDKTPRHRRTALEIAEERFLRSLEQTDPARFQELMRKRLGLTDDNENLDVLRSKRLLEKLGFRVVPGGDDESSDVHPLVREALNSPVLGDALRQLIAGRQGPPAAPATATLPEPPPTPGQQAQSAPDPSAAIVELLEPLSPVEAARWLLSRPEPQAKILAGALAGATSDAALNEILDSLAGEASTLVRWLRARPMWLTATCVALRQLRGGASQNQSQTAPAEPATVDGHDARAHADVGL